MIKINYDPILGCTGWDFQEPKLNQKNMILELSRKLNKLRRRPKNVSSIN